jgi:uncharacterized protein (TIGR00255 family)
MTGFGQGQSVGDGFSVEVALRGVNSRSLDLKIKLSDGDPELEEELKKILRGALYRGRVEVDVKVVKNTTSRPAIDNEKLSVYCELLEKCFARFPDVKKSIRLGDFLVSPEVFLTRGDVDLSGILDATIASMHTALENFKQARRREGSELAKALHEMVKTCEAHLNDIRESTDQDVTTRFADLTSRVQALFAEVDIHSDRLAAECALLVERSDFKEEVDRLAAHFAHFDEICRDNSAKGRPLDFICQEMLREVNTLLSKAYKSRVIKQAIVLKSEIERIREQVQNIE